MSTSLFKALYSLGQYEIIPHKSLLTKSSEIWMSFNLLQKKKLSNSAFNLPKFININGE